ncbi:hypothetical protein N431DRAFT_61001 [Stipitochalara longipes BDJ]|nr:hypothetical protein N431DRAFT_61001 [Stipitochalara longipes BDJ]
MKRLQWNGCRRILELLKSHLLLSRISLEFHLLLRRACEHESLSFRSYPSEVSELGVGGRIHGAIGRGAFFWRPTICFSSQEAENEGVEEHVLSDRSLQGGAESKGRSGSLIDQVPMLAGIVETSRRFARPSTAPIEFSHSYSQEVCSSIPSPLIDQPR